MDVLKSIIKKTLVFKILIQFLNIFRDSLSYIYRGSLLGGFYWFYVRHKVSFFGNSAGSKFYDNYKLSAPLAREGLMQINSLSKETVAKLEKLFLESQNYSSLEEFINSKKKNNEVRPSGISIALNEQMINQVFEELDILPKVKEYLDLRENEIYFAANIDCLINVNETPEFEKRSISALEFHRDVDSLAFVKAFCYLSNINQGCGEHEVLIGPHRKLPFDLRIIGRYNYNDILKKAPHLKLKPIYGASGYSWLEDTTLFHRGTVPTKGYRLMLGMSFHDARSAKHMLGKFYYPLDPKLQKLKGLVNTKGIQMFDQYKLKN